MRAFVDTNIFVRLLARDDLTKAERSLSLFERVQRGEVDLMTSEAIVAEVVYVLSSKTLYRQTREQIAMALRRLIAIRGLHVDHKQSVLDALDRYEASSMDFEDCLAIEHSLREGLDGIYSFDRKLGRGSGIERLEP